MGNPTEKQDGSAFPEPTVVREEPLYLAKAVAGDRPSLYALGMVAARSLEMYGVAVFSTDAAGVVHLLPPTAVNILEKPLVPDFRLDEMPEEEAIRFMLQEGRAEAQVVEYLKGRDRRK